MIYFMHAAIGVAPTGPLGLIQQYDGCEYIKYDHNQLIESVILKHQL